MSLDYNAVYIAAVQRTLDAYDRGQVAFVSEHDLQADLVHRCKEIMAERNFPTPFNIASDVAVTRPEARRHQFFDIVLGLPVESSSRVLDRTTPRTPWSVSDGANVVVEIKFERVVAPSAQRRSRDLSETVCLREDLEKDLLKLAGCAGSIRHRHFLLVDERGYWAPRLTAEDVSRLARVRGEWHQRRTAAGAAYGLLAIDFPIRDQSRG